MPNDEDVDRPPLTDNEKLLKSQIFKVKEIIEPTEQILANFLAVEFLPQPITENLPRTVLVCPFCLRYYDLEEDLRGHFIYHHKYSVKVQPKPNKKFNDHVVESGAEQCRKTVEIAQNETKAQTTETTQACDGPQVQISESADSEVEVRPVPFKNFRLILRSKLTLRCLFSCANKFENEAKLDLHMKCHVSGNENTLPFKCSECNTDMENWRRCSAHLWKVHRIDVDLLHCPICDFKAPQSVLVWHHMRMHKKWRPRVLRSMRAVHQKRRQKSVQVDKAQTPLPQANKNRYYAEKTCDICERKFVNGKTLSKHVKTVHNKIKPFICNVCGKKTARKASLIVHMRQHTGEKPLHCKSCKFATRDPSVLHKHQLRHEKIGKFKCHLCDYNCIQTSAYKRHMNLVHPQEYKKIACDLCTYTTISPSRLQQHKRDHCKGLVVQNDDSLDATRVGAMKGSQKMHDKNNEISADCFLPLESIDSPHEPAVDTGGVTIPAPSEDTQFPTFLEN